MKQSINKKFLFPRGTRLWEVYGDPPYAMRRVNATIVKGWVRCKEEYHREGCVNHCKSGAMRAVMAGYPMDRCLCMDTYTIYLDEKKLREFAESGKLRNPRLRHVSFPPKIWDGLEDKVNLHSTNSMR